MGVEKAEELAVVEVEVEAEEVGDTSVDCRAWLIVEGTSSRD